MIYPGDIVTIKTQKYIDYPGGEWRGHFAKIKKHLIVLNTPTNSGQFKAKDSTGRIYYHIYEHDVIAVKRRAERKTRRDI